MNAYSALIAPLTGELFNNDFNPSSNKRKLLGNVIHLQHALFFAIFRLLLAYLFSDLNSEKNKKTTTQGMSGEKTSNVICRSFTWPGSDDSNDTSVESILSLASGEAEIYNGNNNSNSNFSISNPPLDLTVLNEKFKQQVSLIGIFV